MTKSIDAKLHTPMTDAELRKAIFTVDGRLRNIHLYLASRIIVVSFPNTTRKNTSFSGRIDFSSQYSNVVQCLAEHWNVPTDSVIYTEMSKTMQAFLDWYNLQCVPVVTYQLVRKPKHVEPTETSK